MSARVEALVERGLEKYAQGDLTGALGEWEHAASLDGESPRAREYIEYVRANFDLLDHQFKVARDTAERARAQGVPVPEVDEETSGAYDLIELERAQLTPVKAPPPGLSQIDSGWDLLELGAPAPLPPPPAAHSPRATLPMGDRGLVPPAQPAVLPPTVPPAQTVGAPAPSPSPPRAASLEDDLAAVAAGLEEVVQKGILPRNAPAQAPREVEVGVDDMLTPEPGLLPEEPEESPAPGGRRGPPPADDLAQPPAPGGRRGPPPADDLAQPQALELVADEPPPVELDFSSGETVEMTADEPPAPGGRRGPPPADDLAQPPEPERAADVAGQAAHVMDDPSEEGTGEVTVPGGEPPPPLPDRPSFHADALQILHGASPPVLTIHPRGAGEGTHPGELPAPPGSAAPPDLDLDLGALDGSVADDRAPSDLSGEISLAALARQAEEDAPVVPGARPMIEDTGEATSPAGRRQSLDLLDSLEEPGTAERPAFGVDIPTAERRALGIGVMPVAPASAARDDGDDEFAELEFGGDTSDFADPKTSERAPYRADGDPPAPPAGPPNIIVDERLYDRPAADSAGITLGADYAEGEAFGAALAADVDAADAAAITRPPIDADVDDSSRTQDLVPGDLANPRLRARVNELVSLAREAAERGDFRGAIEAAEAAAAEDPEGKVAPVILHRHRDLLFRIYEGQLGDLTQVPYVAVPLHEMTSSGPLDHRTGFLLSRIDGTLTFEDILDVAGMPRMEAYKILSGLLRKGFIDTR